MIIGDQYQEVRTRFDAADACQSPLAWRALARQVQSHHLDSMLPHRYRVTASSCRLCSGLRDGTETSSTLRCWSSARRAVWTHVAFGRFLYSVRDHGTLCLDCCVTLATTLLALDILWRHSFSRSTSAYSALGALATMRYTNLRFTYLLTVVYYRQLTQLHHCHCLVPTTSVSDWPSPLSYSNWVSLPTLLSSQTTRTDVRELTANRMRSWTKRRRVTVQGHSPPYGNSHFFI